jgi:hypothetical protein
MITLVKVSFCPKTWAETEIHKMAHPPAVDVVAEGAAFAQKDPAIMTAVVLAIGLHLGPML